MHTRALNTMWSLPATSQMPSYTSALNSPFLFSHLSFTYSVKIFCFHTAKTGFLHIISIPFAWVFWLHIYHTDVKKVTFILSCPVQTGSDYPFPSFIIERPSFYHFYFPKEHLHTHLHDCLQRICLNFQLCIY